MVVIASDTAAMRSGDRIRYWLSEEVAARVAAEVVDVLGAENRILNLDPHAEMPSHIVCLPASFDSLRAYAKMVWAAINCLDMMKRCSNSCRCWLYGFVLPGSSACDSVVGSKICS